MYTARVGWVLLTGVAILVGLGSPGNSRGEASAKEKAAEAAKKLKGAKIISIQDVDKINAIDQEGMKGVWGNSPVNDYDRGYPQRLKDYLGIELVIVRSGELLEEMSKVDDKAIQDLTDLWIKEATEVKKVGRNDIADAARMYWAFKALLKKYSAVAITYESATLTLSEQKVKAWTPLPILELSKEHIPCCCQSHVDCLVTQLVGCYLTNGRTGFVGDVLNDWSFKPAGERPENVIVVGHCGACINPHGDDRTAYLIRDHIHSDKQWFGPNDIPTATTVTWPADEPATVVKFDVFRKKVSIFTAMVRDGNKLFVDFPNCICRNKMVVQLDHPDQTYLLPSDPKAGAFRSWWGTWGCHQVVFYGNLREPLKEVAAMQGFEVVEPKQ